MQTFEDITQEASRLINDVDPFFFEQLSEWDHANLDPNFLGFVDIYKQLSEIIPKNRTIIDLGCAYGCQSVFFMDHQQYVGVDIGDHRRVNTPNSIYYRRRIAEWIELILPEYADAPLFAICSFVPDPKETAIAREKFPDLFCYYPQHGDGDYAS
jgi:hypothetical protein